MKPNFQKLISRRQVILTDDIILRAWNNKKLFSKKTGLSDYVRNLEIIDGDFFFDQNWIDSIIKKYSKEKASFFINFIKKGIVEGEKLKKFVRNLKLENKSQASLLSDFLSGWDLLENLLVFLPETHPLAKIIENRLTTALRNAGVKDDELNETLMLLSVPDKLNGPVLEQIDLQKIKLKKNKSSKFDLKMALREHADKYSYLGYREPFSKGYSEDFFLERLKEVELPGKAKNLKIKLGASDKKIIALMKEFVYFRNYRTERLYEALYYLEPLWLRLGQAYGLKEKEIGCYTLADLDELINNNKRLSVSEINSRQKGHGLLLHDDKLILVTGAQLDKLKPQTPDKKGVVDQIRGSIACRGIIRGVAKIVLRASEQHKINNGDILVTSMTTPDYLPSMKKAAAFVTDEGGITCHAAIVARELKKPCIIGTKNATKVLRDGDIIEVDADKGVVKIIK
jgi:phosphohistidine swiveling domain-containing protein